MGNNQAQQKIQTQQKRHKIRYLYQQDQVFVIKYYDDSQYYENEVYCYNHFQDDDHFLKLISHNPYHIIIPFIKYDLFYIIQNYTLSSEQFNIIFKKIIYIVKELHANDIEHNDVKLENILINSNFDVYIIDYEFISQDKKTLIYNGTCHYLPPEILFSSFKYEFGKRDVWSLGIIYWIYIYKKYPIDYPSRMNFINFEKKLDPSLPFFLLSCLQFNPKDRCSSQQLLDLFEMY
jgi:serine/threonine protein kinase